MQRFALFVAKHVRRREVSYSTGLKTMTVGSALFNKESEELFPKTALELRFDHADSWC